MRIPASDEFSQSDNNRNNRNTEFSDPTQGCSRTN